MMVRVRTPWIGLNRTTPPAITHRIAVRRFHQKPGEFVPDWNTEISPKTPPAISSQPTVMVVASVAIPGRMIAAAPSRIRIPP